MKHIAPRYIFVGDEENKYDPIRLENVEFPIAGTLVTGLALVSIVAVAFVWLLIIA
jgi:hypothetical protein